MKGRIIARRKEGFKYFMIISLINNKGGVGKTTTAVNLAAGLIRKNKRTLLIDLDSQGSASLSLGVARPDLSPSSADIILNGVPIHKITRKTNVEGLNLITGSMDLANADLSLADIKGREIKLKNAIKSIQNNYDFIIMDCPPSLSLIPINALVATDNYIIPVTPQYLALEGLANLMDVVEKIRLGIGTTATLLGIVLTQVDYRLKATREIIEMIRNHYGKQVFKTEIRVNVRLSEAPSFGKTIFDYDKTSTGAEAYKKLAGEVINKYKK